MMITMDPHEAKLKRVQDELKQLKKEVETERKKISECAQDLVSFCEAQEKADPMMNRALLANNPFKVRGGRCRIS